MPKRLRRYEILLPLYYNDGTEIEPEKLDETIADLRERRRMPLAVIHTPCNDGNTAVRL